jgi:hypothetical protein
LFQYENEIEDTDKECFELLGVWSAAEILKLPRTCMHVDKILEKLVHAMGEN